MLVDPAVVVVETSLPIRRTEKARFAALHVIYRATRGCRASSSGILIIIIVFAAADPAGIGR
jgi:Cu/Ag efflux pump CusA